MSENHRPELVSIAAVAIKDGITTFAVDMRLGEDHVADAETKRGPCRVCGHSHAELAHTIGRDRDAVLAGPRGGIYRYVHPDSVIPAHLEQALRFHKEELANAKTPEA